MHALVLALAALLARALEAEPLAQAACRREPDGIFVEWPASPRAAAYDVSWTARGGQSAPGQRTREARAVIADAPAASAVRIAVSATSSAGERFPVAECALEAPRRRLACEDDDGEGANAAPALSITPSARLLPGDESDLFAEGALHDSAYVFVRAPRDDGSVIYVSAASTAPVVMRRTADAMPVHYEVVDNTSALMPPVDDLAMLPGSYQSSLNCDTGFDRAAPDALICLESSSLGTKAWRYSAGAWVDDDATMLGGAGSALTTASLGTLAAADLDGDGVLEVVRSYSSTCVAYTRHATDAEYETTSMLDGCMTGATYARDFAFADMDGDGDLDAVGTGQDAWPFYCENVGSAGSPAWSTSSDADMVAAVGASGDDSVCWLAGDGTSAIPSGLLKPGIGWYPLAQPPANVTAAPAASGGDGFFNVTWAAPYDNGGHITAYVVSAAAAGLSWTVTGEPTAPTSVLLPGEAQALSFTVRAVNAIGPAAGESPASAAVAPTGGATAVPSAPQNVRCAGRLNHTILVEWDAPADGGAVLAYHISVDARVGLPTVETTGVARRVELHPVPNGATVNVTVAAEGALGFGEPAASCSATARPDGGTFKYTGVTHGDWLDDGSSLRDYQVYDFDNDGLLDVRVAGRYDNKIMYNNGSGGFEDRYGALPHEDAGCVDFCPPGGHEQRSAVGALFGDPAAPDFVYTRTGHQYYVLRNDGDGLSFTDVSAQVAPADGFRVASDDFVAVQLADFDGDGDLDVFTIGSRGSQAGYFENVGNASWPLFQRRLADSPAHRMGRVAQWPRPAVCDLEGDGDVDIVHAFWPSANINVGTPWRPAFDQTDVDDDVNFGDLLDRGHDADWNEVVCAHGIHEPGVTYMYYGLNDQGTAVAEYRWVTAPDDVFELGALDNSETIRDWSITWSAPNDNGQHITRYYVHALDDEMGDDQDGDGSLLEYNNWDNAAYMMPCLQARFAVVAYNAQGSSGFFPVLSGMTSKCDLTTDGGGWTTWTANSGAFTETAEYSYGRIGGKGISSNNDPLAFDKWGLFDGQRNDIYVQRGFVESIFVRDDGAWLKMCGVDYPQSSHGEYPEEERTCVVDGGISFPCYRTFYRPGSYEVPGRGMYGLSSRPFGEHARAAGSSVGLNERCEHMLVLEDWGDDESTYFYGVYDGRGAWTRTTDCTRNEADAIGLRLATRPADPPVIVRADAGPRPNEVTVEWTVEWSPDCVEAFVVSANSLLASVDNAQRRATVAGDDAGAGDHVVTVASSYAFEDTEAASTQVVLQQPALSSAALPGDLGLPSGDDHRPALGDFDGDGDRDVVVGTASELLFYENTGSDALPALSALAVDGFLPDGASDFCPSLADLDNDGDADLVLGALGALYSFESDGAGGFARMDPDPLRDIALTPGAAVCPALGELVPGTGMQHLVVADGLSLFIVFNNGTLAAPVFGRLPVDNDVLAATTWAHAPQPAVCDFDGDGDPDVLVHAGASQRVMQMDGDGVLAFRDFVNCPTGAVAGTCANDWGGAAVLGLYSDGARRTIGTAPLVPGVLNATSAPGAAHLSWEAPYSGGPPITGFEVRRELSAPQAAYTVDDGAVAVMSAGEEEVVLVVDDGSATSAVVGDMTPGETYTFCLAAVNALGTGPCGAHATVAVGLSGFVSSGLSVVDDVGEDGDGGDAVADLDGDGDLDLLSLRSTSEGFEHWPSGAVPGRGAAADAGDLDGDGEAELVVVDGDELRVYDLLDDGFSRVLTVEGVGPATTVAIGDVTGDQRADIVVNRTVLEQQSWQPPSFSLSAAAALAVEPQTLFDFDGDGDLDALQAGGAVLRRDAAGDWVRESAWHAGSGVVGCAASSDSVVVCLAPGEERSATLAGAPSAPANVAVAAGAPGSLVVSWDAPADNGAAVSLYTVFESVTQTNASTTAQSLPFPDLVPGVPYAFTVAAHNAAGQGPASDSAVSLHLDEAEMRPLLSLGGWSSSSETRAPCLDLDFDGDGDRDLLLGLDVYRNEGSDEAPDFRFDSTLVDVVVDPVAVSLADTDGDGLPDLLLGLPSGELAFYRNVGSHLAPAWQENASHPFVAAAGGSDGVRAAPAMGDLDGDGDADLLVGFDGGVRLFEGRGDGAVPVEHALFLGDVGLRAGPALCDADGDGDLDAFVADSLGGVRLLRNRGGLALELDDEWAVWGNDTHAAVGGRVACATGFAGAALAAVRTSAEAGVEWFALAASPAAPANVRVSSRSNLALDVAWDAPAFDGGLAVTAYAVTVDGEPAATVTGWPAPTAARLVGVRPFDAATVSVVASTAYNASASAAAVLENDDAEWEMRERDMAGWFADDAPPAITSAHDVAFADLDADGDRDLVILQPSGADIAIWQNDCSDASPCLSLNDTWGVFSAVSGLSGFTFGDFDCSGDGLLDMMAGDADTGAYRFFNRTGFSEFTESSSGIVAGLATDGSAAVPRAAHVALGECPEFYGPKTGGVAQLYYYDGDNAAFGEVAALPVGDGDGRREVVDVDVDGDLDVLSVEASGDGGIYAMLEHGFLDFGSASKLFSVDGCAGLHPVNGFGGEAAAAIVTFADGRDAAWYAWGRAPEAPGSVVAAAGPGVGAVQLSWAASNQQGTALEGYVVAVGDSTTMTATTALSFSGLAPGVREFSVAARSAQDGDSAEASVSFEVRAASMVEIAVPGLTDLALEVVAAQFGDVDGDGAADVALLTADGAIVVPGVADNPFAGVDASGASAFALGDMDVDGHADLILGGSPLRAWAGRPAREALGAFTNPFHSISGDAPTLWDFDGDGDLDLFVGSLDGSSVELHENAGTAYVASFSSTPQSDARHPLGGADLGRGDGASLAACGDYAFALTGSELALLLPWGGAWGAAPWSTAPRGGCATDWADAGAGVAVVWGDGGGRARVAVLAGTPYAPAEVRVTAVRGLLVFLEWDAAADNGMSVTSYSVYPSSSSSSGDEVVTDTTSTVWMAPALGEYRFSVAAHNAVGEGAAATSAATAVVTHASTARLLSGLPAGDAVGDVDADGELDVVSGLWSGLELTGDEYTSTWGDVDGDGDDDAVLVDLGDGGFMRLYVNDNGTAMDARVGWLGGWARAPLGAALSDADGDGDVDLVVAGADGAQAWVNDGSGFFSAGETWPHLTGELAMCDMDGDGADDAVLGSSGAVYGGPDFAEALAVQLLELGERPACARGYAGVAAGLLSDGGAVWQTLATPPPRVTGVAVGASDDGQLAVTWDSAGDDVTAYVVEDVVGSQSWTVTGTAAAIGGTGVRVRVSAVNAVGTGPPSAPTTVNATGGDTWDRTEEVEFSSLFAGQLPDRAALAVADITGDGEVELLVGSAHGDVYVAAVGSADLELLIEGSGRRLAHPHVADFDGDGDVDVLLASELGLELFTNAGGGELSGPLAVNIDPQKWAGVSVGDMDGDGRPDLVWADADAGGQLRWFEHNGTHFEPTTGYDADMSAPDPVLHPVLCDLDHDSDLDLVLIENGTRLSQSDYHLFENDGRGGFSAQSWFFSKGPDNEMDRPFGACATGVVEGRGAGLVLSSGDGTYMVNARDPSPPASAPRVVGAVGASHVDLEWDAPAAPGGAAVVSYVVVDLSTGQQQFTAEPSVRFTSLAPAPGWAHSFAVRARNEIRGVSDWSLASDPVEVAGLPDAPADVWCYGGDALATVSFTGSSSSYSYEVDFGSAGVVEATDSSVTASLPLPEIEFTPTVTAVDGDGRRSAAVACDAAVYAGPLVAAFALDVLVDAPVLAVSEDADGTVFALLEANATIEGALQTAWGDVDGDGDEDAVMGTRDGLLLQRRNAVGALVTEDDDWYLGVSGAARPALGDVDGDGAVDLVVSVDGALWLYADADGAVALEISGTSPALCDADGDGDLDLFVATGDAVATYEYVGPAARWRSTTWQPWAGVAASSVTCSGLHVDAAGALRRGLLAAAPTATRDAVVAHASLGGAAVVEWGPPANDGGAPVTEYWVIDLLAPALVANVSAPTTWTRLTGLDAGQSYSFVVQAVNRAGQGLSSWPTALVAPLATPSVLEMPWGAPASADEGLALSDVTGDGVDDLLVFDSGASLLLYAGNGSAFDAAVDLGAVPGATCGSAAGDFDGDGAPDLVIDGAQLLRNSGSRQSFSVSGSAAAALVGAAAAAGRCPAVGDLDADGDPDVVLDDLASFLRNDGGGEFVNVTGVLPGGARAGPVSLFDWDGDGDLDLFAGASVADNVGNATHPRFAPLAAVFDADVLAGGVVGGVRSVLLRGLVRVATAAAPEPPAEVEVSAAGEVTWSGSAGDNGAEVTQYRVTEVGSRAQVNVSGPPVSWSASGLLSFTVEAFNAMGRSPASTASEWVTVSTDVEAGNEQVEIAAVTSGPRSLTVTLEGDVEADDVELESELDGSLAGSLTWRGLDPAAGARTLRARVGGGPWSAASEPATPRDVVLREVATGFPAADCVVDVDGDGARDLVGAGGGVWYRNEGSDAQPAFAAAASLLPDSAAGAAAAAGLGGLLVGNASSGRAAHYALPGLAPTTVALGFDGLARPSVFDVDGDGEEDVVGAGGLVLRGGEQVAPALALPALDGGQLLLCDLDGDGAAELSDASSLSSSSVWDAWAGSGAVADADGEATAACVPDFAGFDVLVVRGAQWFAASSVPDAVDGVALRAHSDGINVSWAEPAAYGAPVTQYTVTSSSSSSSVVAESTWALVTGLAFNAPHSFWVTAESAAGAGEPSATASTRLMGVHPSDAAVLRWLGLAGECDDAAVECTEVSDSDYQRVRGLDVAGRGLAGAGVLERVARLPALAALNASGNALTGAVPALPAGLLSLDVSGNAQLAGALATLPDSLVELRAAGCAALTGALPDGLAALRTLDVRGAGVSQLPLDLPRLDVALLSGAPIEPPLPAGLAAAGVVELTVVCGGAEYALSGEMGGGVVEEVNGLCGG